MNRITTVGELRAVLTGLPDDAVIRPAINRYQAQPGLYVIRYAQGTCNAAYAEVQVEQGPIGVQNTGGTSNG
jgi:hypothetical protein